MSAESLKDKMRDFTAGKLKSVNLSSEDLAYGSDGGKPGASGPVIADIPKEAKNDAFSVADTTGDVHANMLTSFIDDKIDITDSERAAFLDAIVTGGRYEQPFSIFGGKITGVFRCRKVAESDGINAWLGHCTNTKKIDVQIEYMSLMRNAILAAQVKSLRGLINEDFPEMAGPLAPARSADGKDVKEPGWVPMMNAWGDRPEALVTAIHFELQKFERRYWTMVVAAGNQNFWNPAASI